MAKIENRSRYFVAVKNNPALKREFPFNKEAAARAYLLSLREMGHKPVMDQYENRFLVRIRQVGHPEFSATVDSLAAVDLLVAKVEGERKQGLFVDYNKSLSTTTYDLIERYIREELPRKKHGKTYAYVFEAMLEDCEGRLAEAIRARDRDLSASGRSDKKITAMRTPMGSLEWLRKPFIHVEPMDIIDWMRSREGEVAPATIWRQYEMLRALVNLAINTWRYPVRQSPLEGIHKTKFNNARNRRLTSDEKEKLLAAAVTLDHERSKEKYLRSMINQRLAGRNFSSESARKKFMLELREQLTELAAESAPHQPQFETLIRFQLATAARRSEALQLTWDNVNFAEMTAFLPETKNGSSRKLVLREDLIEDMKRLPRTADGLVFDMSVDRCVKGWRALMENTGIENLTLHDLRHEAISAVAETRKFSVLELAHFSGHKDLKMLARYTHFCATKLARDVSAAVCEARS